MSIPQPKIVWNPGPFMKEVSDRAEEAASEGATKVLNTAYRLLDSYPMPYETGNLRSKIKIKKVKWTKKPVKTHALLPANVPEVQGYIIRAETIPNKEKYDYAVAVELGTSRQKSTPYIRPALKKSKRFIRKRFKELLKDSVGGR